MLNYPSVPKIIETPANAVAEAEEECQVCIRASYPEITSGTLTRG